MNKTEKEFVNHEQALELKELGFDEPCFGYHGQSAISRWLFFKLPNENAKNAKGYISDAPTFSQAFSFFRDKYKLYPEINLHDRENEETWRFEISVLGDYNLVYNQNINTEPYHKSYEEARLQCLKKLIEIAN
jgi:hypothetical protein